MHAIERASYGAYRVPEPEGTITGRMGQIIPMANLRPDAERSLRAITRMNGISRTTLLKILADVGQAFSEYQVHAVQPELQAGPGR